MENVRPSVCPDRISTSPKLLNQILPNLTGKRLVSWPCVIVSLNVLRKILAPLTLKGKENLT